MEAVLYSNEVEKGAVAHNSQNIDDTKGNPDPAVESLQTRYSHKDEGTGIVTAQIIHGFLSLGSSGLGALKSNQLSERAGADHGGGQQLSHSGFLCPLDVGTYKTDLLLSLFFASGPTWFPLYHY